MKILLDISSWYFIEARFIVIAPIDSQLASDFIEELLPFIHNKIYEKVVVSNIDVPKETSIPHGRLWKNLDILHQAFLLVVERGDAMVQFLRFIQQNHSYSLLRNPRGHFLIIILGMTGNHQNDVKRREIENKYCLLFQNIWKEFGILNIIMLVINTSDYPKLKSGHIALIAAFNPFIGSTKSRGKLIVHNENYIINLVRSHTDRLNNLRGYPVRITLFSREPTSFPSHSGDKVIDYIGMDGFFMRNLARKMNFTPIADSPKDGREYGFIFENNGTSTGTLGDILDDRADLSLNSRFVKEYGTNDIEFTIPVGFDSLCIIVPKAKQLPKWLALFRVFDLHVQFSLVCVYVVCSIIIYILQILYSHFKSDYKTASLSAIFIEMLTPFLSLSLARMPSSRSEKVLVILCLVFGMIIASSFQAKLVTVLSKPDYYPDINTLEELDASNLIIATGSINLVQDTFSTEESPPARHLRSKVTYCNLQEGNINYVAKHQNIAALNRLSTAMYSVLHYRNSDGTFLLHIVKECPKIYSLAYIVHKGSPFLLRINHVVAQLEETGIVNKWKEDTYFNMTAFHRSEYSGNYLLKVFSLEDLQMPFLILVCGLFSSAITFFAELTAKHFSFCKGAKCKKLALLQK
ncbi:hypothetical protein B7P43_G06519 [Cryptotermes secundus]|uniref:Ionotropic glutamate receptor C-terminal domain-containing protein n=1 Tax=Cryptotermes secundus TaxID=105785 RepID=A0A2J7RHE7_9NEOP|nr:ionotropic receptor 21a [Cryptotermes secundus]PNF40250.1 hypothetical protein B7P43_G06519 [Cryptotermes secundus]